MTTTTPTPTAELVPAGTYAVDPVHSSAVFEVEHAGLSIYRGGFKPIDARLVSDGGELRLEGAVQVEAVGIDDENLRPHLLSPEFFDAERNPEIRFRSTKISGSANDLRIAGELSMAGASLPVEASGRLRGPITGPDEKQRVSLALSAVIDRTDFGMNWQMDLPGGEPALANEVKIVVELELGKE
jgi:polyisoprenoid-binding protein YceI